MRFYFATNLAVIYRFWWKNIQNSLKGLEYRKRKRFNVLAIKKHIGFLCNFVFYIY